MAAFPRLNRSKKLTTYGKATRKRLPGTQAPPRSISVSELDHDELSPASSLVDVFDVSASDDDEERVPVAESRKRKLGASQKVPSTTGSPPKKVRSQPRRNKAASTMAKGDAGRTSTEIMSPPVLGLQKLQNRSIRSPRKLSRSELRMQAVRKPSTESIARKDTLMARPRRSPVKRTTSINKVTSIEVEDRMASVSLYTPKKDLPVPQTLSVIIPFRHATPPSDPAASCNALPGSITPRGKVMLQTLISEVDKIRANKPRRRLIDTLMEQEAESEDSEVSEDACSPQEKCDTQRSIDFHSASQKQGSQHIFSSQDAVAEDSQAGTVFETRQKTGIRTYKEARRLLAEPAEDFESQLADEMPMVKPLAGSRRNRQREIPTLKPIESLHEAGTNDTVIAIRSVHEVRLAGAKSHFVDGVEHLLVDIGKPQEKPSSSRRSALVDLATKLLDRDYRRQFLENGLEQGLFRYLAHETDVMAGFLLASLLFIVMSSETTNSLTIDQLRHHGISELLVRLLEVPQSIDKMVKNRKYNMSKVAQSLFLEYQALMLRSKLWEEDPQICLSPRTMAMLCIKAMVEKGREASKVSDIISHEMMAKLFGILQDHSDGTFSEIFRIKECQLALSVIEFHSPKGLDGDMSSWNDSYLPFIYDLLLDVLSQKYTILRVSIEQGECLQDAVKLVLSLLHLSSGAASLFSRPEFIATAGNAIVAMWGQLSGCLEEKERSAAPEILNYLTLLLMEISGLSMSVLLSFDCLKDTTDDFLPGMVQVFNDREESSSQVSTIDETSECVPLGFLAFLLGHLGQAAILKDRIASHLPPGRKISYLARYINSTIDLLEMINGGADDTTRKLKAIALNLTSPATA